MLNVKLLAGSFVGAASVLKLWSDPGRWGIILDVVGALLLSWIIFVAVLWLTAIRLRREPGKTRRRESAQTNTHASVEYGRGFTRISR
jgi:hypothetical protein